ncbi:unnamed protein product [Rangifer tarandus platyrhynchus]|uniref:Uncharacterized protein n=2 Tax=Rangifer tarandus platyrhynchus TaxID=3082113 RepID=A0ACB0EZ23_RANTA|nr:unnamed protein product [Rangifer tarandus platyrhynchus]
MEVAASLVTVGLLDRSRRLVAGIRRSSAELQEVYEEESDLTEDGVCAPRPRESQTSGCQHMAVLSPRDIRQHLEIFWVHNCSVLSQGYGSIPRNAQDSPLPTENLAQNVRRAIACGRDVERPHS